MLEIVKNKLGNAKKSHPEQSLAVFPMQAKQVGSQHTPTVPYPDIWYPGLQLMQNDILPGAVHYRHAVALQAKQEFPDKYI